MTTQLWDDGRIMHEMYPLLSEVNDPAISECGAYMLHPTLALKLVYRIRNEYEQRIADLEAEVERLRNATQMPQPDWSKAPSWAQWWAVDARGISWWYRYEPAPVETEWYIAQTYLAQHQSGPRIDLSIGLDWRTTLQQRPQEPQP